MADAVQIRIIKKKEVIMPAANKMGPEGRGPLTGRRMGLCVGNNVSGSSFKGGFGRGFRRGFSGAFRRGFGNFNAQNFQAPSDKEAITNEMNVLKEQLSFLEQQLAETQNKD